MAFEGRKQEIERRGILYRITGIGESFTDLRIIRNRELRDIGSIRKRKLVPVGHVLKATFFIAMSYKAGIFRIR